MERETHGTNGAEALLLRARPRFASWRTAGVDYFFSSPLPHLPLLRYTSAEARCACLAPAASYRSNENAAEARSQGDLPGSDGTRRMFKTLLRTGQRGE
jgi:hypothetical protein